MAIGTGVAAATTLFTTRYLNNPTWPGTLGEDYRRCCTSSAWIAEALAARLVRGLRGAWNHPAFFAYADRWMRENDAKALAAIQAQIGADYSNFRQRRAWDAFATNMWRRYRRLG